LSYDYGTCSSATIPSYQSTIISLAPQMKGMADTVEIADGMGHRFAVVGDFGGRLHVFDITPDAAHPPCVPTYRQSFILPPSVLDGYIDNVADVALDDSDFAATGKLIVYLAAFRIGVIELTLQYNTGYGAPFTGTQAVPFQLGTNSIQDSITLDYYGSGVRKRDTPGLAHDVTFVQTHTGKGLLVADKMGGLRVFGNF
jgi:hypothetical protein